MQALRYSCLLISLLLLTFTSTGCASTYKSVEYDTLSFTGQRTGEALSFSYHYDAIPGYYGKKLRKRGYSAVAVEVTNDRSEPVVLDRNSLTVYASDRPINPVSPQVVADQTQQPVWTYLLWSLLTLTIGDEDDFVFIPIGVPISLINMFTSSAANGKAATAYRTEHLYGQRVESGETAHGLLFFQHINYPPLEFYYENVEPSPRTAPSAEEPLENPQLIEEEEGM